MRTFDIEMDVRLTIRCSGKDDDEAIQDAWADLSLVPGVKEVEIRDIRHSEEVMDA